MTKEKCIICHNESFFLKTVNQFDVYKCLACGLEFIYPMPTNECLESFYAQYSDIRANKEVAKRNAINNLNDLQKNFLIDSKANILDYGCGNNLFIEACREKKLNHSYGYDQYSNAISEKYISYQSYLKEEWHLITLWGVLEHLISPVNTLLSLKNKLSKNGIIALTTIYIESEIPFQYKPPEHTLYFTKKSLQKLADATGLTILSFEKYRMEQHSDIYLSILLRTMAEKYKQLISHQMPKFVEIPTNEVHVVFGTR